MTKTSWFLLVVIIIGTGVLSSFTTRYLLQQKEESEKKTEQQTQALQVEESTNVITGVIACKEKGGELGQYPKGCTASILDKTFDLPPIETLIEQDYVEYQWVKRYDGTTYIKTFGGGPGGYHDESLFILDMESGRLSNIFSCGGGCRSLE